MPEELSGSAPESALEPSLEELTSEGIGSGLEAERSEEPETTKVPFDPSKIDVITQQRTVDLLLTRLQHRELDLSPDFQRRANLWNEVRKSALIESMLLRIPIPSLYVSEDEAGNYTVVDGLQRMCSVAHFVDVAALNAAVTAKLNPLRLNGLQSLKELEGKSFPELPRPLQRRIQETELTLHVIRVGTPTNVKFNIFYRINQGGLPLNAQEIRNALFRGEWREQIREMATGASFLQATEGRIKGERMEDLELVLRFAALFSLHGKLRQPDENLDEFLNNFVEKRCNTWTSKEWTEVKAAFDRALKFAPQVFGRIVFRKFSPPGASRRPINRGLFETETVAVATRSEADLRKLSSQAEQVIERFRTYFENDKDFYNSLLSATGRGLASNKRLEVMQRILDEAISA